MTLQQIYDLAVKMGAKADLRGEARVRKLLLRTKEKYQKLDEKKKKEFDSEKLVNPYSDTRILLETAKPIKKILAGIDIAGAELFLADRFSVDLIISHHPLGKALAALDEVMHLQAEILEGYGVPINIAESLLKVRISEVSRSVSPANHNRIVDAVKYLNIGLMSAHTVCDNLVANFLKKEIEKRKFEYVGEIMDFLKTIPEYQEAIKINAGPRLFSGSEENRSGRIALTEITGGTEGSPKIYEKMAQAGIGTIIAMHLSEKHKEEAEAAHINTIVAGHISSDSIGMNLFLDELEKKGIKVYPCSGLIRVKRFKKK
jgi:putative NIF3 family GTP cyclohydrolase 1 type 2